METPPPAFTLPPAADDYSSFKVEVVAATPPADFIMFIESFQPEAEKLNGPITARGFKFQIIQNILLTFSGKDTKNISTRERERDS